MKIAVASEGKVADSIVSSVSGRAPYYLIFENGKLVKTIKNPFRIGGGGAGFGIADMLSDEGVELVVSGRFGGNMVGALDSKNMKHEEVSGISVEEALEKFSS